MGCISFLFFREKNQRVFGKFIAIQKNLSRELFNGTRQKIIEMEHTLNEIDARVSEAYANYEHTFERMKFIIR